MKIHILGVCGTFMGGVAQLAKQLGHDVSGSDTNIYPPMSHQLEMQGIPIFSGYDPAHISKDTDVVIVGNVISRGNPAMEYILENQIPYTSGPQWLAENILRNKWVLAVAGTHGKTTTTSLLTWILESSGKKPSFLIGGVPENFGVSAKMNQGQLFVIEADEYDSAFFDKRSKFIHYHPKTIILNNLEFDHADIFADIDAIKQQFHYLVRTIPSNGMIISHAKDANLKAVLAKGCWTKIITFSQQEGDWQAVLMKKDGSEFEVFYQGESQGYVTWNLLGSHNVENALAALAAAQSVGVDCKQALPALSNFKNVKKRLEVKGRVKGITIYDDFAHHPTAIATTLKGLREKIGKERMIAVLEFGSYTMRAGVHQDAIQDALATADIVLCKRPPGNLWNLDLVLKRFNQPAVSYETTDGLVSALMNQLKAGDHVVTMSNSSFDNIHNKLLTALE